MRTGCPPLALVALLAVAWALPGTGAALAEERPRARLDLDPCIEVDPDQVERLFTIELGAQLVTSWSEDASRLSVTCGAAGAVLRVDDPVTGKSLMRVVDLGASPPRARARLLALALAELLFTSWTELEISLTKGASAGAATRVVLPDGRPLSSAPARRAASLVVRRRMPASAIADAERARNPAALAPASGLRLLGLASGQAFRGTGLLLGGGLRLGGDYSRHLGFSADVLGHHGQDQFALGAVTVDTLSASAALLVHGRLWRLDLRAGAGLRGGAARLSGEPQDKGGSGATVWGPFGGPMALLGAGVALPVRLVIEVLLEGGYVALPVGGRVGGERAVAVEGPWLAAQLGVGLRP